MDMLELVGQVLAYSGVGLGILVVGFFALDVLTPDSLGRLVMQRNPNAAMLSVAMLISLGLVLWFAIFFTGAGWGGLDDVLVYGAVAVGAQVVGFVILDLLTPGRLGEICADPTWHPASAVSASVNIALALIISASLT